MIEAPFAATGVHNLGAIEQIPLGEGRVFIASGQMIAVFRPREGGLYATQAACPHAGGPLADGLVGSGHVVCPLHANKYCLDDGKQVGSTGPSLVTHWVALNRDGEILVRLTADDQ